ncbi:MAG: HYR domain-containing protein [Lewinellaceae bacterium]|nr:HYR domain-containing protein [Lewinellaceae bacterium]
MVPNLVPEVVATDNCEVATITQSPLAGTSFGSAHGDMIFVTITVTDIYGNVETCKVKLTLHDDENPTIDCSQIPTALNNTPGYCHYFVPGFNLNPTYGDNCGPLVLTNNLTGNNTLGGTPLAVGSTTVIWMVTDAAGNTATCSVTYVVTDNEPPVARCQGPVIDIVLDGDGLAQLTVADVNNDSWDNCGPLSRTEISRGGAFGQWVYFSCADIFINNGIIDVILEVEDQHNNVSQCTTQVAVYDLESPVITCPNGIETTTDPGVCTAVVNGIALQYVHDNCPVTITYEITGATIKSGTGDASGSVFNKGVSVVTYTVVDESGNSAVCSFDVEVYDEENPIIDCTNIVNIVRSNNTDECSYTVVGTEFDPSFFSDNCPGATISNNYNNSPSLAGAEFPVGLTIVIWTVTDASGNTVTCSSKVTVNDTQLPTITCPTANATQFVNDVDQCSKTILDGSLDPAFADNCPDATITHNYVTAPNPWTLAGANFPVGSTTVIWTVKDKAGNTASCSITVVVTDTQVPEFVNCPTTMVMVGNDVDQCSGKVNWSIPVAEDNCDILSILQTGGPASGTIINVSPNPITITYTATDIHGNTALCTFQVLVVDTQNPEFDADITMPNDITVECNAIPTNCVWHGNGGQLICSPLVNSDVHDNCTAPQDLVITFTETSTQCANQAQCCFYNYTITRTWKVTDQAGNMLVHT